jgi:hypothetical protein
VSAAFLLLLARLLAPQQPIVSASVDRTDVLVGDVVILTVRVVVDGAAPVRVPDPILSGLELRGSHDVSRVRVEGGVTRREVTRELRLVAVTPGRATIGAVRIHWGDQTAETAPIAVTIGAANATTAATLSPRLRAVLDTLRPPPPGDEVVAEVLAIPETVTLGEQLDLVTLAWFPRELRLQLRTPPTLTPPDVQGAWTYQQATAPGVVASRELEGHWYDLFVSHQVVFPLSAGAVAVGRATVSYVRPLSYSFLSRELQHEVQSESLQIAVDPQPGEGRPADFSGAAGGGLTLTLQTSDSTLVAGGAATVSLAVSGTGNVALWPEPRVAWPPGLRVYPSGVEIETETHEGLIGGTKWFRYLLLADSAGRHLVPGSVYPYFETATGRYAVAATSGLRLTAPPGVAPALARPLPPPLMVRGPPGIGERFAAVAGWVWIVLAAIPPFVAVLVPLVRRWPRPARRGAAETDVLALEALDQELRVALERRVGTAAQLEGVALAAALRAAGVETSLAQHVTRVRDRVRHAVFGPQGTSDRAELSAEVHELLRALAGQAPGAERRELVETAVVLLAALLASPGAAQAPRPEALYQAGAFQAAADSFAARVARQPGVAAYWYNLGAAYFRMGDDGRARVAWVRAARLAPRRGEVRRAAELLPADPLGRRLAPVAPITPAEGAAAAFALWVAGWVLVAARRARRLGLAAMGLAAVCALAAWWIAGRYREPAAVALEESVPLRGAPFAAAEAPWYVPMGGAVRIERSAGAWLLVSRGDAIGWVRLGEVARL